MDSNRQNTAPHAHRPASAQDDNDLHTPRRRQAPRASPYQDQRAAARAAPGQEARPNPTSQSAGGETWRDFLKSTAETLSPPEQTAAGPSQTLVPDVAPPPYSLTQHHMDNPSAPAAPSQTRRKRVLSDLPSAADRRAPPRIPSPERTRPIPGSSARPIDLITPPRSRPQRPPGPATGVRSNSSLVLPRWQPDEEVSACPVCQTPFTFWYRKHHCRKCGKVVCAACSQHRITIPRQYIVQPPSSEAPSHLVDDQGSSGVAHLLSSVPKVPSNVGGGEVVRICNPCVPDPNLSPPPQEGSEHGGPSLGQSRAGQTSTSFNQLQHLLQHQPQSPSATASLQHSHNARHRSRSEIHPPSNYRVPDPQGLGLARSRNPTTPQAFAPYPQGTPPSLPFPFVRSHHRSQSSTSPANATTPHGHASDRIQTSQSRTQHQSRHHNSALPTPVPGCSSSERQPPARAPVNEADQCPICYRELPPLDPQTGSDARRTGHVMRCVARAEARGQPGASSGAVAGSAPSGSIMGPPPPLRDGFGRERDMLRFQASEKDCVGGDGITQECVICLEDFEVAQRLGRLECLCKFHESCLDRWWAKKGKGACPTHQPYSEN